MGFFRGKGGKATEQEDQTWVEGRSVKYSAARLKEKGVLLSVDGATDAQYVWLLAGCLDYYVVQGCFSFNFGAV